MVVGRVGRSLHVRAARLRAFDRGRAGVAIGALLCLALSACADGNATQHASRVNAATTALAAPTSAASAGAMVSQLKVAPEGSLAGYDRARFGTWIDADGNGCDTRAEVLRRQSRVPPQVDPFRCTVVAGDWLSSYDGRTTDDPAQLDIDHVVALAEAWRSGAAAWDDARRRAFANDLDQPGELVAVTATANRSKGDHDPASWRPPNRASWCEFGTDWVRTKLKWGLTADEAEVSALRDMLHDCSA